MNLDEIMSLLWRLLSVAVLVFLNGFFVAAEFALVKLRHTQIDPLIKKGHRRAVVARRMMTHLDRTIGATQLGITLVSLGLGVLVEPVFEALLKPVFTLLKVQSESVRHGVAIGFGFFVNTFLLVVIGELGPKALAIRKTLPTALWTAQPLAWFYRIAFPLIWLLNHAAHWLLQQIGIEPAREGELHSEDELRLLFATTQRRQGTTTLRRDLVLNAFDLPRRIARQVMRPRQQIVGLSANATIQQSLEIAEHTRFSRFPILEQGNLDRALGFIHVKDLFAARGKAQIVRDLLPLAKKLVYVPETSRLERLLEIFLERKVHMAFVVDEYGGTVGLLTLENILEELVGQIQDEFDQETPLLVKRDENTWSVDGALPLHDLADVIGEAMNEEGVTTASGWVTHRLGGFPKIDDVVRIGAHELRVEEMEGPRVSRLLLQRVASTPVPGESDTSTTRLQR
jgi:CBS domain containing-hemolysin-like protein